MYGCANIYACIKVDLKSWLKLDCTGRLKLDLKNVNFFQNDKIFLIVFLKYLRLIS